MEERQVIRECPDPTQKICEDIKTVVALHQITRQAEFISDEELALFL